MKNPFKKSKQKEAPAVPRSLEDIKKEYNEILTKSGNAQYLVFVYTKELEQLNRRLLEVNQEAGVRQSLDAQVKKEQKDEQP